MRSGDFDPRDSTNRKANKMVTRSPTLANQSKSEVIGDGLFWFVISVLLWAPMLYWRGYVIVDLWKLFITPLTHGQFPAPSIYAAVGAMFVLSAFLPRPRDTEEKHGQLFNLIVGALYPAALLGLGHFWVWLQWGVL